MIRKSFAVAMLIIGTIIGAGFASGREIISFFGSGISVLIAFLCGGAIFALCALFLWLGSVTKAKNVSELNVKLIGRLHVIPDCFLLLNSLIVLGGMLAGMNSLGNMFIKASPLFSIIGGILCIFVVHKGIKGLLRCNNIVVPLIIIMLFLVCGISIFTGGIDVSLGIFKISALPTVAIYVSMNMMLASTVLTTLGNMKKKEILLSSAIAAIIMTVLILVLILSLNSYGNLAADMPVLEMAKAINPVLYGLIAIIIAVSIFTTMLTAMSGLCAWFGNILGRGLYCPIVVFLAGMIVSYLGFMKVVALLYPLIGLLGLFYIVLGIIYAIRYTASARSLNAPFYKRNNKIHKRGEHAKNNG